MGKKRIDREAGRQYLSDLPSSLPMAVRYLLQQLADAYPGGALELRVPPFGAVQLLGGMDHRRGTPPNVVEVEPELFIAIALGERSAVEAVELGQLKLSGVRAKEVLDLLPLTSDMY